MPMRTSKARALMLTGFAAAGLLCCSCAGPQVRDETTGVQKVIDQARKRGAKRCAPRDLAIAEANTAFANVELEEGNADRAEEHIRLASQAAERALANSASCAPKKVLIERPKPVLVIKKKPKPKPRVVVKPKPKPKVVVKKVVLDTDHDGILDDIDRCPLQPEDYDGFQDEDGCPDPDNDQDGVPDVTDACPNMPGPAWNQGCPFIDSDGDGVPDFADKCPHRAGPVDNQGCPRIYTLVVLKKHKIEIKQQVHFATNRYRILPDSYDLLDQVAQVLKDYPRIQVRIEGHTDSVGKASYNLRLSQHRAESVRTFLVDQGVSPDRMTAQGYGETVPIATNATARGRAMNRRVEFTITAQ